MILQNFVPILAPYFSSEIIEIWFYPLLALCVVATVPCIFKQFWR